ncbi:MAG: MFS transporter [Acidimicrobiaceae bacterium]|nr:MFS transporter [Acidimicrobiaceae bacterium]
MEREERLVPNRWWSLAALTLPVLIISMDATILGFAIPELSTALAPSSSQLLWIIDVYSFVLAGLLVTMGIVGDRIGRRRLLLIGAAGFSVASVLAAFAPNAEALIAARALLGVAGATLMPSTLALIRNVFVVERERQLAIAIWAVAFSVGAAIGPIVGGFLLDHYWWGSVFLVGVPVTVLLLFVGPRLLPESRDPDPQPFDIPSAALSMMAMFAVVYAMKSFAERGSSTVAWIVLALGLVAGYCFVRRQRRLDDPMIDVDLFRIPRFTMAISGNTVACFGFSGSMYFVAQHLQLVIGMTAFRAGLSLLPSVVATIGVTLLAPSAARRFGTFRVISLGLTAGAVGFTMLALVEVGAPTYEVIAALLVLNSGLSAAMAVSVDGVMSALPPERAGAGASVSETANELGIALGTAVLGSIAATVYRGRISDATAVPTDSLESARETLGAAQATAAELGGTAGERLVEIANAAFVDGTQVAATVAAVTFVPLAVWAWRLGAPRRRTAS